MKFIVTLFWVGMLLLPARPFGQFTQAISSLAGGTHVGNAVSGDDFGESYVTGQFNVQIDFGNFGGPILNSAFGPPAAYVARINSAGNMIWAAKIESNGGAADGIDIVYHQNASLVVVTGYYQGTLFVTEANGNVTNYGGTAGEDMYAMTFDLNGNLLDVMVGLGLGNDRGRGVAINPNTNVVSLAGSYTDQIRFYHAPAGGALAGPIGVVTTQLGTLPPDLDGYCIVSDLSLGGISGSNWLEGPGEDILYSTSFDGIPDAHYAGSYDNGASLWQSPGVLQVSLLPGSNGKNAVLGVMDLVGNYNWDATQTNSGDVENFDVLSLDFGTSAGGWSFVTGYYTTDLTLNDAAGGAIIPMPHNCSPANNTMSIFCYDATGVPLWGAYVESCMAPIGFSNGAVGYGLSIEGNNSDILYIAGHAENKSQFFITGAATGTNIPFSGGVVSDDVDAVLLKLINPNAPPFLAYANGVQYAQNGNLFVNEYDAAYDVYANQACDLFTTGEFSSFNATFWPLFINPGACGGSPCPPKMFWTNKMGCFWKTDEAPGLLTGLLEENAYTVAPNPSSGMLSLISANPAPEGARLSVQNLSGQEVFSSALEEGGTEFRFNLHDLPAGMYVISLASRTGDPVRVKWVKQ